MNGRELRFFGGLSVEETGGGSEDIPQSVMRDWKLAKAWLMRELSHEISGGRLSKGSLTGAPNQFEHAQRAAIVVSA
jgi:hypothetical protein